MAPTWISAVKAVPPGSSSCRPSSFSTMVRCPVLDTGRNSVSPSTMPSSRASSRFIGAGPCQACGRSRDRSCQATLSGTPAVSETARGPAHDADGRRVGAVIDGFGIGHATADGAGDVRGGGPGTRETDLLDPLTLVERVDAVVLTGGSAYGLATADGVMSA